MPGGRGRDVIDEIVFLADETDADDLDAVAKVVESHGLRCTRCHPDRLSFHGSAASIRVFRDGVPFSPALVVGWVYEDWLVPGAAQLETLALAGIPTINDGTTLLRGQNKAWMSARLHAKGVSHAETWTIWGPPYGDAGAGLGFPLVVKPGLVVSGGQTVFASGGGVSRIDDASSLAAVQTVLANLGHPLYLQSFVDRPDNRDLRVWVFGDRAIAAVAKVPGPGLWITHAADGCRLEPWPLSDELAAISVAAAAAVGAPIAGVDVGESAEGLVVFEVNTCPTFLPAHPILGDAVPEAFAEFLLDLISRGGTG